MRPLNWIRAWQTESGFVPMELRSRVITREGAGDLLTQAMMRRVFGFPLFARMTSENWRAEKRL